MQSLDILLERAGRPYSTQERVAMAERKNNYYKQLINKITAADILPGALDVINGLKSRGVKVAIASSSKNAPALLKLIGLDRAFDAVVSGNDIERTKPDPQVFLLAAEHVAIPPAECLVVEDAGAGVEGALNGGMRVLAVGAAAGDPRASARAVDLTAISIGQILAID
jgi:beta-phosphoglucomutase